MKLRWPHRLAIALLALLCSLVALLAWTLNTQSGTRWALQRVQAALDGKFAIGSARGTLAGPLQLDDLRYGDASAGFELFARRIRLELNPAALLRLTLHIRRLELQGVRVALGESAPKPADDAPFSLEPPVDILLDAFSLRDAQVARSGELLAQISSAALAARWTAAGVELRQLDVRSPQGEVHFTARVAQREYFQGEGTGRFRWRAGEHELAGRFDARTRQRLAQINLQLSAPVSARLAAQLEQQQGLPWTLHLDLPAFDPRAGLAPDSSVRQLGAQLQASGTAARGQASGTVLVNGESVRIETLDFTRSQEHLELATLLRLASNPEGTLRAQGNLRLAQRPVAARLQVDWQRIVVPADLAGQVLHSHGRLEFDGSAAGYTANGNVTLGPPRRLAQIQLRVAGNPRSIELQQVDIVQPAGRLAARGRLLLQPQLGWQLDAQATRFDPGAFAAAWPGSLNFAVATSGERAGDGITAHLSIEDLTGRLRNRVVAGRADLQLAADAALRGTLDLRSGASRVHVTGCGSRQGDAATDVTARVDIASLDDWLPGAGGNLHAQLDAQGRWPELRLRGTARGSQLQLAGQRVGSATLDFDVTRPLQPLGSAELAIDDAALGGFEFSRAELAASGDAQSHRLSLTAQGTPVAVDLGVTGTLREGAWEGELQQLILDARDVARLQLTRPVRISHDARATSVSEACFADRDVRLCAAGEVRADGAAHGRYSVQNVPLALPITLLAPDLPLALRGTLQGEGELHREPGGGLTGSARLRSTEGDLARRPLDEGDSARRLIAWRDLALEADLRGATAQVALSTRLDDSGSMKAELSATGLDSASTALRGTLHADLPSIAVLEAFAPQLDQVQGRLALQGQVAGTLDAPQITGALSATDVAMGLPQLGLKLRDGRLRIEPQGSLTEPLRVTGQVASGSGRLEFSGTATTAGSAHIDVTGENFLAADIPGVRVNVTPKLAFERSAERMTLTGDLRVQGADIDLQKLPRGNRAQAASPDVVIIDEADDMRQQARAAPLFATVGIDLGEQVKLVGYGLDATVAGRLTVRERPGEATTGSGEIRVAGTYKAYGQDLTIRQGQLLYAQTPLDNPRLAIVAVRTVDTVTAGLRVAGTAQSPQLTVFSDPVMGQSSALSYLVAGKPLEQIGSGEGDALQSAARSLGTAAGGLLAKNIGKRLGVDELGVKDSAALGGAALTVGQYLSPRLYLSYGVGLFTPGEVLTLRYRLARGLSLEVENAAQNSRAGVKYRVER